MGSIVGFLGRGDRRLLDRALRLVRHRGDAGRGVWVDAGIGLAHSFAASPFATEKDGVAESEGGRVRCVLDGRLLEPAALARRLAKKKVDLPPDASHAELVANAYAIWGDDAFAELDGAFAIALAKDGELRIARDALGEKPLYYTTIDGTVLFASEIKAFFAHPKFRAEPEPESLNRLLVFSFIPGEETMFKGVREVLPGHFVKIAKGRTRSVRYWELVEALDDEGEESIARKVRALTREAVKKRVPPKGKIGAFLSGGVDSSAVVAILKDLGHDVTSFSIGFGHGVPNELMYARMVTQHCGTPHRVVDVEPKMFLDLLPTIIWSLDDPLCDCITVPNYLLAREASKEVDLIFNGEGGDPLFGGPKNKFLILGEWYQFLGGYDRRRAYLGSYHKFYDYLDALYTPEFHAEVGGSAPLEALVEPYLFNPEIKHLLNRLMHVNIKLKGGQNILVKVDKMLSANAAPVASPLFDKALAEFSFRIPPPYKRRGDVEKYAFKKAIEHLLPHPVVYRKKAGMGVPLNIWFRRTELKAYAADLLRSQRAKERGYFDPKFVDRMVRGKPPAGMVGQDRSGELLWMLMAVELWHRVFVDGERPA